MFDPKYDDLNKDPQNEKKYAQLRRKDFFIKKDAFETSLEDCILSDKERTRLTKAMEYAFSAGNEKATCIWVDSDLKNAKRVDDFFKNDLKRIENPDYSTPNQKPESD